MDDFASESDSEYTSYWKDWVSVAFSLSLFSDGLLRSWRMRRSGSVHLELWTFTRLRLWSCLSRLPRVGPIYSSYASSVRLLAVVIADKQVLSAWWGNAVTFRSLVEWHGAGYVVGSMLFLA